MMPYLMVNLNDEQDCRQAIQQLRNQLHGGGTCHKEGKEGMERGRKRWKANEVTFGNAANQDDLGGESGEKRGRVQPGLEALPLRKKLMRIRERGIWPHLVEVAKIGDKPRSLPEFDKLLTLPRNKMRSLKAIMAKLENRFDLRFLVVDEDAGKDESGNPRYQMPANIRRQILKLSDEPTSTP